MPVTARLSNSLHRALGDEPAGDLVDWMQQLDTTQSDVRHGVSADMAAMRADMAEFRQAMGVDMAAMRADMAEFRHAVTSDISTLKHKTQSDVSTLRQELQVGIATAKADASRHFAETLKWSFLFWLGTVAAAAVAIARR